jgi:nucleotide-binding universal stress UspA family protein
MSELAPISPAHRGLDILVATDFSEAACRARDYAIALAAPGGRLRLVHASVLPVPDRPEPSYVADWMLSEPSLREELLARLREFGAPARAAGLRVEIATDAGEPSDLIVRWAERYRADLIAIGTEGRRGFEQWVLGSTAERVVRLSPVPVLTVSSHARPIPHGIRNILCTLDRKSSPEIAGFAAQLARNLGSAVTLLHVLDPIGPSDRARVSIEHRLAECAAGMGDATHTSTLMRTGAPSRRIVETALSEPADLVVMGIHDGWWWTSDRGFLGSTADRVIRTAPCAVVTVRESAILPRRRYREPDLAATV